MPSPRSRVLGLAALTISLGLVPLSLSGQIGHRGQFEVGFFGSFTRFDRSNLGFQQKMGGGGRLGFFLTRALSLEASGEYAEPSVIATGDRVTASRFGGTLLLNLRVGGANAFYFGAGYERLAYRGAVQANQNGAHLVVGDRLPLGARTALRLEGRAAYIPNSTVVAGSSTALNLGANFGISIFTFGGPPRDGDRDGVRDKSDRCADTPTGATVDVAGCPGDDDGDRALNGLDACPATPQGARTDDRGCPSDSDADAVLDGLDSCPDTPAGARVDPKGCPTDEDADTVFDGLDQCAATPAGAKIDALGCPIDTDGDKVFDGFDQCPDTPVGAEVDANGCTVVRDTDGDGVVDPRDRCPNTAAGQQVDAQGCPLLFNVQQPPPRPAFQIEEARARPVVLKGVTFQTGRSALSPESYAILDEVAASLVANLAVRIEISGHTDATGSRAKNTELSQGRALAVKAYLAQKGVNPERMDAVGRGPDRPVAPNTTAAGRAQNRRVELAILP